jgi:hypothetical protein
MQIERTFRLVWQIRLRAERFCFGPSYLDAGSPILLYALPMPAMFAILTLVLAVETRAVRRTGRSRTLMLAK